MKGRWRINKYFIIIYLNDIIVRVHRMLFNCVRIKMFNVIAVQVFDLNTMAIKFNRHLCVFILSQLNYPAFSPST